MDHYASYTKILIILLVCLFLVTPVAYAERSLTFGLWTQHYRGDHTEGIDNRLIALEYNKLLLAEFKNSYGNETAFIARAFHTDKYKYPDNEFWLRGNLYVGVLIGYGTKHPIHFGVLSPGMYPTAGLGYKDYSIEIGVMPAFFWLGLKVEF